ncbi:DUF806 family protein [Fructobacillus americanaquae]|uniref:DUF806 family protein n=1 Tax=Fructobacillus americanaquae TaxID=2940302 RepID=A0ABY5C3X8_9LACO|nr:DUF806 family protein [Fructobacillus americanaquae]USS92035.1 DUF806 family protein [Fructobacillus americanaquae]
MTVLSNLYKNLNGRFDWADRVYVKSIPSSAPSDSTFIFITDSTQQIKDFGSNTFQNMQYDLEIQIFYSTKSTLDYDSVELDLMRFLNSNGYVISNVRGRIQDPDTFQDYQTIIVSKTERGI